MDIVAISAALAAKYLGVSANGETIGTSTEQIPTGLPTLPCVLVFPPTVDIAFGTGMRTVDLAYKVDLFDRELVSDPTDYTGLNAWLTALADVLLTGQSLGGLVTYARTDRMKPGAIVFDGAERLGIEIDISVHLSEPVSTTA